MYLEQFYFYYAKEMRGALFSWKECISSLLWSHARFCQCPFTIQYLLHYISYSCLHYTPNPILSQLFIYWFISKWFLFPFISILTLTITNVLHFCPIINTVIFLEIHQSICPYHLLLQNNSRRWVCFSYIFIKFQQIW